MFLAYLLLIVIATPFSVPWPVRISFWIFSLILFWIIALPERSEIKDGWPEIKWQWLILPIALILISRLLPFFRWGEFPLGADAAVYIENYTWPASAFYGAQIVINLLLGLTIYLITKEYFGQPTAFLAFMIFSLSEAQFLNYWLVYSKTTAAIILSLAAFYFLEKKSWLAIPTGWAVIIIHPLTFLPFAAAAILRSVNVSTIIILLSGLAIGWEQLFGYLYYSQKYLGGAFDPGLEPGLLGHFVEPAFYQNFLALSYLPLAIMGLIRLADQKKFNYLFFYTVINFFLIFLRFTFHHRFLIHLDVMMIILAAWILKDLLAGWWKINGGRLAAGAIFIFLAANIFYQSWQMEPLINSQELAVIKNFSTTESNSLVAATDPLYFSVLTTFSGRPTINLEQINQQESKLPIYFYIGRRTADHSQIIHSLGLLLGPERKIIKLSEINGEIYKTAPR